MAVLAPLACECVVYGDGITCVVLGNGTAGSPYRVRATGDRAPGSPENPLGPDAARPPGGLTVWWRSSTRPGQYDPARDVWLGRPVPPPPATDPVVVAVAIPPPPVFFSGAVGLGGFGVLGVTAAQLPPATGGRPLGGSGTLVFAGARLGGGGGYAAGYAGGY